MFGSKQQKAAQDAAARAEVARLTSLSAPDLAAEIMKGFGPGGVPTTGGRRISPLSIASWLMKPFPRGGIQVKDLLGPVKEGVQALENAGLVLREPLGEGAYCLAATRLGETALAGGSVREHLAGP